MLVRRFGVPWLPLLFDIASSMKVLSYLLHKFIIENRPEYDASGFDSEIFEKHSASAFESWWSAATSNASEVQGRPNYLSNYSLQLALREHLNQKR